MPLSFNKRLKEICEKKDNRLCIGLDVDPDKFPKGMNSSFDSMENFLKDVIDGEIIFRNKKELNNSVSIVSKVSRMSMELFWTISSPITRVYIHLHTRRRMSRFPYRTT